VALGAWGRSGYNDPKPNLLDSLAYQLNFNHGFPWSRVPNSPEWQEIRDKLRAKGLQLPDSLTIINGLGSAIFRQPDAMINCNSVNTYLQSRWPGAFLSPQQAYLNRSHYNQSNLVFKRMQGAISVIETPPVSMYDDMGMRRVEHLPATIYYADGTSEVVETLKGSITE
jgi:hypothetical protein